MPRFVTNRWWAFILALTLGFALLASASAVSTAGAYVGDSDNGGDLWGGGGMPPPGSGDPDSPLGSTKGSASRGAAQRAPSVSASRVVGDNAPAGGVMMWHLRIVLRSLGLWYHLSF